VRTPRTRAIPPLARRFAVVVLLVLAGPLPVAPALAAPVAADDVTDRARSLIDGGRPAKAVPLLEEAAVARPGDATVVFLLGVAYHRTGQHEEALVALAHAAALAPDDGLIHYNLGAAHFALGHFDEAAEAFLAVPDRAPEAAASAYLNAGLSRYKAGRVDEAKDLFGRTIQTDPEGSAADTARRLLDRLAPRPAGTPGVRTARRSFTPSAWFYAGREFDSNVFALPDDATTTDLSDWRTTARGEAEVRVPVSDRYDVTPHYDFYGYWYHAEHAYNYRRHRAWLRLNDRKGALRPRLTGGYEFAELGGEAYVASSWLDGRLTVRRTPKGRVWLRARVAVEEAPGHQYDYLSGTSWEASVSAYRKGPEDGWLYGALRLRYRDRGTADLTLAGPNNVRVDYSYASVEPRLKARTHLPWRIEVTGEAAYEVRRYLNDDTWSGPPPGSKRRLDQRVTGGVSLSRPLYGPLRATLAWTGQVRRSNITANDYRDRDYERQLYGLFIEGDW